MRRDHDAPRRIGETEGYEVGYCKPPVRTRFMKGQSGNPGGRPKSQSLHEIYPEPMKALLREEAYRSLRVKEGDKVTTVPAIQAIFRSLVTGAAKGHFRSQRLLAEMLNRAEEMNHAAYADHLKHAIEYKLAAEGAKKRAKEQGKPAPELRPNPDDIVIDSAGNIFIKGPLTVQDEERDKWLKQVHEDLKGDFKDLSRELKRNPGDEYFRGKREEVASLLRLLEAELQNPPARRTGEGSDKLKRG